MHSAHPPRDEDRITQAIRYLIQHAHSQPTLAQLASTLNLSEYHLQRLFTQWAGISPKRFLQQITLEAAKAGLQQGEALLPLAHKLGLSGSSRLHDLFVTLEAMTPGEWRAGGASLTLHWSIEPSRFGPLLAASTPRGLCMLHFLPQPDTAQARQLLQLRWPQARLQYQPGSHQALVARLFQPLGEHDGQPLRLHVHGSNFQIQVWRALLAVPYGSLCSYGQLAQALGKPGAARAVGSAVGANPIAWLIPCHRVIRASGALGGYRWGENCKLSLLGWEAARQAAAANEESTARAHHGIGTDAMA